jgi:predicted ABC-type ATPase
MERNAGRKDYLDHISKIKMPNLYIIAGCNGAGKTTASYTILPEILNCREFVNADSIAAGLSPFNYESVAFEAGRIMLQRIHQLIQQGVDFAFETTLAAKSFIALIREAKAINYEITLLYFWLSSPEFAMKRVAQRVSEGGHDIPADVIERRYFRGLHNLINLYMPVCDNWIIIDNEDPIPNIIARGSTHNEKEVINNDIWEAILKQGKL